MMNRMNKMLKKIAIVVAATTMALASITGVASAKSKKVTFGNSSHTKTKYVTSPVGANVRKSPSTDSKIIKTLDYNQKVKVKGKTSNGWYYYNTKNPKNGKKVTGYINGSLLSKHKGPELTPEVQPTNNAPANDTASSVKTGFNSQLANSSTGTFTVNVDNGTYLALRTAPEFDSANEIAQLQPGTVVQIVNTPETVGDGTYQMVLVPATHQYGYVNGNYLA